jgi:hypothetical protein
MRLDTSSGRAVFACSCCCFRRDNERLVG